MMQTQWAAVLEPVISSPIALPSLLSGVVLNNGVTVVNHKLGRVPQGWILTDINGSASIFRSAAFNPLTLTLTSNQTVTVGLAVF